jgi:hypothetical protein
LPHSAGIVGDPHVLTAERPKTRVAARVRRSHTILPDALIAVALAVPAFIIRLRTIPRDGLWHDDAVTTLGAVEGSARQLLVVGFDHPGFTLVLRSWWWVTGGNSARMADLALVAGALGPPALYLVLRRFGYVRSISCLLGAALVASEIHIIYSGRVRSYVIDVLVVLALTAIVPLIARRRWSWRTAVGWLACAVVVGSLGAFALVAFAAAGIILVLHSVGDRRVRVVAVAAQLAVNAVFFVAVQRTYNAAELRTQWDLTWDAFLDVDLNPIGFGVEVLRHLTRVATVFPGGPNWWAALCIVAALAGLFAISRTGRHAIRGRFLLLLVLVGLAGGIVDRLPFGPSGAGRRVTLWLVPVVAVGLAAVLQFAWRQIADRSRLRLGFDIVAFALAALVVVAALWRDTPEYPFPGSKSAAEFIDARLGKNDKVLVYPGGRYSYALEARSHFALRSQDETIGFVPVSLDARRTFLDDDLTSRQIFEVAGTAIAPARRVFILIVPGGGAGRFVYSLELLRRSSGFEVERTHNFDDARVMIWTRTG